MAAFRIEPPVQPVGQTPPKARQSLLSLIIGPATPIPQTFPFFSEKSGMRIVTNLRSLPSVSRFDNCG
jgi:hypothetical protein